MAKRAEPIEEKNSDYLREFLSGLTVSRYKGEEIILGLGTIHGALLPCFARFIYNGGDDKEPPIWL